MLIISASGEQILLILAEGFLWGFGYGLANESRKLLFRCRDIARQIYIRP